MQARRKGARPRPRDERNHDMETRSWKGSTDGLAAAVDRGVREVVTAEFAFHQGVQTDPPPPMKAGRNQARLVAARRAVSDGPI